MILFVEIFDKYLTTLNVLVFRPTKMIDKQIIK